ncbi:MAG: ergothioneine biosynthesis glutamate--cysteine ligase EgtA, partial [Actinomycetota bacterium]|nr:ergothioneine biosynthesis glutamate--cysteine ligase EgtA [Actinomycetota bacterium]
MPVPLRQLTLEGARDHISARCLEAASPDLVGLESEWLSVASEDHARAVPLDALERVARGAPPMPCASALTFEPGGQVELSGPPVADIGAGCTGMATDLAAL